MFLWTLSSHAKDKTKVNNKKNKERKKKKGGKKKGSWESSEVMILPKDLKNYKNTCGEKSWEFSRQWGTIKDLNKYKNTYGNTKITIYSCFILHDYILISKLIIKSTTYRMTIGLYMLTYMCWL